MSADEALDFFNGLSRHLDIELTEPATPIAPHLMNLAAPASAAIKSVALRMQVFFEGIEPDDDGVWQISWGS
jgi:hypothetical protein